MMSCLLLFVKSKREIEKKIHWWMIVGKPVLSGFVFDYLQHFGLRMLAKRLLFPLLLLSKSFKNFVLRTNYNVHLLELRVSFSRS